MTKSQSARYWRDWGKIRKMLVELGDFSEADADAERMQIHIRALGTAKSSKDLTNRDLDKIFKAFTDYLVLLDGPKKPTGEPTGECKRLIWAITQTGLPEPYLASIAQDQFGTPEWRTLPEDKLTKFRFTAVARAAAKRKAARS
jgi:hypothetical protein